MNGASYSKQWRLSHLWIGLPICPASSKTKHPSREGEPTDLFVHCVCIACPLLMIWGRVLFFSLLPRPHSDSILLRQTGYYPSIASICFRCLRHLRLSFRSFSSRRRRRRLKNAVTVSLEYRNARIQRYMYRSTRETSFINALPKT